MEDIQGNLAKNLSKNVAEYTLPTQAARERSWSILLVDNFGQTITVRKFKQLVIIFLSVFIIALAAAIYFFFLYMGNRHEQQVMQNSFTETSERVKSLQNEKDILNTRLVMLQSEIDEAMSVKKKMIKESVKKPPAASLKADVEKNVKKELVGVKDFQFIHNIGTKELRVNFIVKNADLNSKKVSGRIFVLLKHDETDQKRWVVVPSVKLNSGKPADYRRGQFFKISRYKTVKFKVRGVAASEDYKIATIFVYSKDGDKILEEKIPVNIKTTGQPVKPQQNIISEPAASLKNNTSAIEKSETEPVRTEDQAAEIFPGQKETGTEKLNRSIPTSKIN